MRVSVIIPAAGGGRRLKACVAKPFVKVAGKEIIYRVISRFDNHPLINEIILSVNKSKLRQIKAKLKKTIFKKEIRVISGGATRTRSIANALKKVSADAEIVLIHDVARPFVSNNIITATINAARAYGAAVAAVPLKATIKSIDKNLFVNKTLDRSSIYEAQTPQAFKRDIIFKAYRKLFNKSFTDDSSVVERLGHKIKIVKGSYFNIKITTPEDLVFAKAIARRIRTI